MKNIKILSISDIHLGHPGVSVISLSEKLHKYFIPKIKEADLLLIAGDVFHTLLSVDIIGKLALAILIDILDEADKHGVCVRLLRGTYTHDRTQCEILSPIVEKRFPNLDYRYFDKITSEYISKFDIKMLYIPDSLAMVSANSVIKHIKELFSKSNWDRCDLIMMHGYFRHVLPKGMPNEPKITFSIKDMKELVTKDGLIISGHVHTPSVTSNVIYNGSFDRLAHGEEEKKGFFFIDKSIKFIENKDAEIYKTIYLSDTILDQEVLITELKTKLQSILPDTKSSGNIRVIHPSNEIRKLMSKIVAKNYPNVKYSHKSNAAIKKDTKLEVEALSLAPIDEESLPTLIKEHLTSLEVHIPLSEIKRYLNE